MNRFKDQVEYDEFLKWYNGVKKAFDTGDFSTEELAFAAWMAGREYQRAIADIVVSSANSNLNIPYIKCIVYDEAA